MLLGVQGNVIEKVTSKNNVIKSVNGKVSFVNYMQTYACKLHEQSLANSLTTLRNARNDAP